MAASVLKTYVTAGTITAADHNNQNQHFATEINGVDSKADGIQSQIDSGVDAGLLDGNDSTYFETVTVRLSGQSGGTDGKVLRLSGADTWTEADKTDTNDQLFCLAMLSNGVYYGHGSVVENLSGLSANTVYYLDSSGSLTATPPTVSASVARVAVGKALSTTTLFFRPTAPVRGE